MHLKADAYYYLNENEQSLEYYLKSISTYEQSEVPIDYFHYESLSHAGFLYREFGRYDKALFYYQRSVDLSITLGDSVEIASSYSNLGSTYAKLGNLSKATMHFKNAYDIDLLRKDTMAIGFDLRNLAEMQLLNHQYSEALASAKASLLFLSRSHGNANSHGLRMSLVGKSFAGLHQYDSAIHYLNQSTQELLTLGDSLRVSLNWLSLSQLEINRNRLDKALTLVQQSFQFLSGIKEENAHKIEIRETMASIHLKNNQPEKALPLINQNLVASRELGLTKERRNGFLQRALFYESAGNYQQALTDFKTYKILNDSISTQQARENLAELTVKYDVDNLNQSNKILQLEVKLTKEQNAQKDARLRWILLATVLIISGIVTVALMYNSREKLKNQLLGEEINNLRNQIKLVLEGDISSVQLDFKTINNRIPTPMSDREIEILQLALSDMSNTQIAEKTFVSVNTVKFHLKNIYDKLGVANRKEALQFALNTNS
ncbi:MAG: tetratricopeptide repeat protein [Flammeovirgaceae bacterium]|nr:tetratricopeptide repeat protein [Flammeovirgaceae bacterium]